MTDSTPPLDYAQLNRELDRVKTKVFLSKSAGFLGPLMCTLDFSWREDIKTAATDGLHLWWNPHFFNRCKPTTRMATLVHELWHPGLLHMVRRGDRIHEIWNIACDYAINNMLDNEGYIFDPDDIKVYQDHRFGTMNAEAIYDELMKDITVIPMLPDWEADMVEPAKSDVPLIVNNVVAANMAAQTGGSQAGSMTGELASILKRFLDPKLPWDQLLDRFFNSVGGEDITWARPNKRHLHSGMYLPSRAESHEGLDHIVDFLDVSGSVDDNQVIRFNSEIKYIKEKYNPKLLTLVLFDTEIKKVIRFTDEDPFDQLVVVGRGGTSLRCVYDFLIKEKPDAAVIFSDLHCRPMKKLPINIPLIWVAIDNRGAKVNEGKLVHVKD